jgi:hypothetical protein
LKTTTSPTNRIRLTKVRPFDQRVISDRSQRGRDASEGLTMKKV